jgi:hypothetical protein
MSKIPARTAELESVSISDDGKHAVYQFRSGGEPINLALPESDLMYMMLLTSQASGRSQQILKRDSSMKYVAPCEWWTFFLTPDRAHIVLSFRMPGGLEMSFQVAKSRAHEMIETLQVLAGLPVSPPAGTTRQ